MVKSCPSILINIIMTLFRQEHVSLLLFLFLHGGNNMWNQSGTFLLCNTKICKHTGWKNNTSVRQTGNHIHRGSVSPPLCPCQIQRLPAVPMEHSSYSALNKMCEIELSHIVRFLWENIVTCSIHITKNMTNDYI